MTSGAGVGYDEDDVCEQVARLKITAETHTMQINFLMTEFFICKSFLQTE